MFVAQIQRIIAKGTLHLFWCNIVPGDVPEIRLVPIEFRIVFLPQAYI